MKILVDTDKILDIIQKKVESYFIEEKVAKNIAEDVIKELMKREEY